MQVSLSKKAQKDIDSVPDQIQRRLIRWVLSVHTNGLAATRKTPGWHDEPLKGDRKGQRSIRLNKAYRAIYEERTGEILEIVEVNKHKY